jgi:peptidyl-prolyl cis-trans isomerase C
MTSPLQPAFRLAPSLAPRNWVTALLCGFAVLACLAIAPARAQEDPVVAKVDGVEIKQSDLDIASEELGANLPAADPETKRGYLITYVSDMILVAKAAQAKGLASTTEFARKLAYTRSKLLMEDMLAQESKAALNDEALHKVYEEATKQMADEQEVKAAHILVETEDEAKAIEAELKKGADFGTLAKEKSKDPGSGAQGGDLGYFTKEQMVPEFSEVAFKLDKGQISDPVKSQFGWHIIKVEDKRKKQAPEFEQVKQQLAQYVVRKAQADFVTKLREGAKIEKMTPPAEKK